MNVQVGYLGCKPELPNSFPLDFPENSGNMIHARAPKEIFPQSVYAYDRFPAGTSFRKWVNESATHLIVTLANTIRLGKESLPGLLRLRDTLEQYDAKIVVFGMGVQAPSTDLSEVSIAPEAVELMQYLGERCEVVGVRGKFTQDVFAKFAGVSNTFVTGCPSLFSKPDAVGKLYENYKRGKEGRPAFNGTYFHRENEKALLVRAIQEKNFLVEPVNKHNHRFFLESMGVTSTSEEPTGIPYFLKAPLKAGLLEESQIYDYYRSCYRLFRQAEPWYSFLEEMVSFSFGSRFHGNMAAYLAGVPSLWLTHDARTEELVNFLHLPNLALDSAVEMSTQEIIDHYDPEDFFDNVRSLFANFNAYLDIFGLPEVKLKF